MNAIQLNANEKGAMSMTNQDNKDKEQVLELAKVMNTVREMEKKLDIEKRRLYKEYLLKYCKYKVGDLFKDHIGTIRIKEICIASRFNIGLNDIPYQIAFKGDNITLKGTINKTEPFRIAYLANESISPLPRRYHRKGY